MHSRYIVSALAVGSVAMLGWQTVRAQEKPNLPTGAILRIGSGTAPMIHAGEIQALAFSPDGKLLASSAAPGIAALIGKTGPRAPDNNIRLWDVDQGKEAGVLKGHTGAARHLYFLPAADPKDEPTLVSAASDNTIRFWNAKTRAELPQIINHPGPMKALAISPDGKKIASAGGKNVYLWDAATGNELLRWEAHPHGVACLAFGPGGKTLATGGGTEVNTGGVIVRPQPPFIPGVVAQPTQALDNTLALWDSATGKALHYFAGHSAPPTQVALSRDGKTFVALCRSLNFWGADTGKKLRQLGNFSHDLVLTPDGRTIVTADSTELKFNDIETGAGQPPLRHKHRPVVHNRLPMAFSADGAALATGGEDGRIVVWDVRRRIAKGAAQGPISNPISSLAVSPDGKTIVTVSLDGVMLWNRATGELVRKLELDNQPQMAQAIRFLPDNRTMLLVSSDHKKPLSFWNATTGKHERSFPVSDQIIQSFTWTPDGALFANVALQRNELVVWDQAGREVRRVTIPRDNPKRPSGLVSFVRLSPNGQHLLVRLALGRAFLYDIDTGMQVYQKPSLPYMATFSPGGVLIASTTGQDITLMDATSGADAGRFSTGSPKTTSSLTFAPDGRVLAMVQNSDAGDRSKVDLFEIATGKLLKSFSGHSDRIGPVAFTPEGKALITGSQDCTVLVWDISGLLPAEKMLDAKASWNDLANADRLLAYAAFCRLRAIPAEAVPALKAQLAADTPSSALEKTRTSWAVRLLEDLNTPAARTALDTLAEGNGPAAIEARGALKRLNRTSRAPEMP